jgi:LemA protein
MGTALWIAIGVVVVVIVLLVLYLWVSYNSFVTLRARVDEAWKDITVQFERRAELMPSLAGSVRSYADHEKAALDAIESARAESLAATTPAEASAAEDHVQRALRSVFAVSESFPQLQASPEFLQLQGDLVEAEERIQASRRFYNGGVRELNTKIERFPNSVFARRAHAGRREFFEAADVAARAQPPRIQF